MTKMFVVLAAALFATTAWAGIENAKQALDSGEFDKAIFELQPLADAGDVEAQYWLGLTYDAISKPKAAVEWIKKAAESGHDDAQRMLGIYYDEGKGVAVDELGAACWYRQSAMGGNPKAQRYLGLMFADGRGVARDDEKAAYWLERAVEAGNPDAMKNLAHLYRFGVGVPEDRTKAAELYAAAAKHLGTAKTELGKMYYRGKGEQQNLSKAIKLFNEAAEAGDISGQYYLGRMYAEGEGTDKNYAEAYFWFTLAANAVRDSDDPNPDGWRAHEWLSTLDGKLEQEQIRSIEERARGWRAK